MTTFRIEDAALVPEEFKWWTHTYEPDENPRWGLRSVPDEAKIRAALEEKCERCEGTKVDFSWGGPHTKPCPICHGSGLRQIPGVERVSE